MHHGSSNAHARNCIRVERGVSRGLHRENELKDSQIGIAVVFVPVYSDPRGKTCEASKDATNKQASFSRPSINADNVDCSHCALISSSDSKYLSAIKRPFSVHIRYAFLRNVCRIPSGSCSKSRFARTSLVSDFRRPLLAARAFNSLADLV